MNSRGDCTVVDRISPHSASSTHLVVADSGHYLHLDQPQMVLEAIRTVVQTANRKLTRLKTKGTE